MHPISGFLRWLQPGNVKTCGKLDIIYVCGYLINYSNNFTFNESPLSCFKLLHLEPFFYVLYMFTTVLQCLVSGQEICSKSRYANNHLTIWNFGLVLFALTIRPPPPVKWDLRITQFRCLQFEMYCRYYPADFETNENV